jgi:hypothetical protein
MTHHHLGDLHDDIDLPVYGIAPTPTSLISSSNNSNSNSVSVGPNGGVRAVPGSGVGSGRKSSENQHANGGGNLNHLLGLRMPPRAVVGSGMNSGYSGYSAMSGGGGGGVTPRRSRGIRNSFNKDSESSCRLGSVSIVAAVLCCVVWSYSTSIVVCRVMCLGCFGDLEMILHEKADADRCISCSFFIFIFFVPLCTSYSGPNPNVDLDLDPALNLDLHPDIATTTNHR